MAMIRDITLSILKKLPSFSVAKNEVNTRIAQMLKATKDFLKRNPNVILIKVNRGNIRVALNNNDYKSKVLQMLEDKETYMKLKKDTIITLTNDVRDLLLRLLTRGGELEL